MNTIPLLGFRIPAGFPSPADDYLEGRIDLNEFTRLAAQHNNNRFEFFTSGLTITQTSSHLPKTLLSQYL